jgi:alpha/beta superfamily hydrolase
LDATLEQGTQLLRGAAGAIEVLVDVRDKFALKGLVILAHPQPLLGGSAQHKVPQFLAKGFAEAGYLVVRPNFRGVGRSEGVHDHGEGETQDLLEVVRHFRTCCPREPVNLVGFSFGAYVQAKVAKALEIALNPANKVMLAGMPFGEVDSGRSFDTPQSLQNALVIHGEDDERVSLSAVLRWARPHHQMIRVMPGADHFFTGKLHLLRREMLEFARTK